jgi:hypothetical protein
VSTELIIWQHLIVPQCFKYIVTNPPRPLTEEDIWFQIGHVYEQQKEVCRTGSYDKYIANALSSSKQQRAPTAESSSVILITPRCCNS